MAVGIDISGEFPKPWTDELVRAADAVNPAGMGVDVVQPVHDAIRVRVEGLLASLGVEAQVSPH